MASVGVVGSGTMATGIIEVFAKAGYDVTFVRAVRGQGRGVQAALARSASRGDREGPDDRRGRRGDARAGDRGNASARRSRTSTSSSRRSPRTSRSSRQLFRDLDRICKPGAILATTTSSLPIIDCAEVTSRPEDVIGMHFFNPAQIMKLVEVVHTVTTAPEVIATVQRPLRRGRQGRR